jgi:glycosyltransferase involved in cell wall biosynthesis
MGDLEGHLAALIPWLTKVKQVVVVDSQSTDGTIDYLYEHLCHSNLVIIDHPPGLYASWNAALEQVDSKYVYFATVGDTLPFESLVGLYEIAINHAADVVISPPKIQTPDGTGHPRRWPIHRYCEALGSLEPYVLPAIERFIWNVHAMPGTLIGSSSSNLYRTAVLQSTPFPCDYGHAGDSAWAISRPWRERWVVAPAVESVFVKHEASGRQRWGAVLSRPKLYHLAVDSFWRYSSEVSLGEPGYPLLQELSLLLDMYVKKGELAEEWETITARALPWFLNSRALALRRQRKQLQRQLYLLAEDLCERVVGSKEEGVL